MDHSRPLAEADESQPRLHVLGSGLAIPSADRDNIALALDTPAGLWLVDCGGSLFHRLLKLGLDPFRLRGVFLSHSHVDHMYGLPALLFHLKLAADLRGWREDHPTVTIYGNRPAVDMARAVVRAYEIEVGQPPVRWHELPQSEDHCFHEEGALTWFSTPVAHSRPTLAAKAVLQGYSVVYSADTEPCDRLVRFAAGADLLLHECTVPEPLEGHSTPQQVGQVAARAGVARLLVIHYDPGHVFPIQETRALIRKGGFAGEILFAEDGMSVPLGGVGRGDR
jgi:ribonuclease Z